MAEDYDLAGGSAGRELTEKERREVTLLIVDPDKTIRNAMRHGLVSIGYDTILEASDHNSALEKLEERPFSHVIFDARNSDISSSEFLRTMVTKYPHVTTLATSSEPTVDDVFKLLIAGAKGFIVKPFTAGTLDDAISWATKGDPITEAVRYSQGRNEALAAVILSSLDKLALVMRQSRKFETAKLEIPNKMAHLKRALSIARTFARGGDPMLREALIDFALQRSDNNDSRVTNVKRRARKKPLVKKKTVSQSGSENNSSKTDTEKHVDNN